MVLEIATKDRIIIIRKGLNNLGIVSLTHFHKLTRKPGAEGKKKKSSLSGH